MRFSHWLLLMCLLAGVPVVVTADEVENTYQQKVAALPANDANAHFELGRWCNENGLSRHAHDEFEKTIEIDPEHAHARHLLGYEKVNGKWYKGEAIQIAKGLVPYHGQWVTKEFAENSEKGLVLFQGKWITLEERYQAKGYVKYHGTWISKERMHLIEANQAKARERIRLASDWSNAAVLISKQEHFQFKSNIPAEILNDFSKGMEQFYQALSQMFNTPEMKKPIPVEIYATQEQFMAASRADDMPSQEGVMGYFYSLPSNPNNCGIRCFYAGSVDDTLSTLYHECTHLIIHTTSKGSIPRWLDEGLAVYFEGVEHNDRGINLQTVPFERLHYLNEMFQNGQVDLNKLCNIVDVDEYTVDYYPQGWSMVYYLLYAEKGKNRKTFSDFFTSLGEKHPPMSGDEQFKQAFLRYPDDFRPGVQEFFKNLKPKTVNELVAATTMSYQHLYDFVSARMYAQKALDESKERNDAVLLCNARLFLALGRWHAAGTEGPEDYQKSMDFFAKYFAPPEKPPKVSVKPASKYTVAYGNERLDYARACMGAGHYEQAQGILDDLLSKKEYQYDGDAYSCQALLAVSALDPTYHDLEVAKENVAIADDLGAFHENKYVHGLIELQQNKRAKAVAFFSEAAARDVFGFAGRVYRREVQRLTRLSLKSLESVSPNDGSLITYEYIDDSEDPPVMISGSDDGTPPPTTTSSGPGHKTTPAPDPGGTDK